MTDASLTNLLRQNFNQQAVDAAADAAKRMRIDVRTAGFPSAITPGLVEWMGMSPAPGKKEGWYVIIAQEEPNVYLTQVNAYERLVQITKVMGKDKDGPLSFETASERLAVWEMARIMKGDTPAKTQEASDLGRHHYKDLMMRRGYLASTTGHVRAVESTLPSDADTYLKSDLDALQMYREGLSGERIVDELIQTKDPLYISETSIAEDLQNFGEIGVFNSMRFFTKILVEYAGLKLKYVQDFFADPTRKDVPDVSTLLVKDEYFNGPMIEQFNNVRKELAGGVFRFFHVAKEDWDQPVDLDSKKLRVELLANPDAKQTFDFLTKPLAHPMKAEDLDTVLFVSARALLYLREMLDDSPRKDLMERQNIYRSGDIDDLLNFLDLLEIKQQYMELAAIAVALPGTARYKELGEKKTAFEGKIASFKDNLKDSQQMSPAQEQQIDSFIKASTPIYMLDRIAALPEKLNDAFQYIVDRTLPIQNQLRLELDFSSGRPQQKVTSPTRQL